MSKEYIFILVILAVIFLAGEFISKKIINKGREAAEKRENQRKSRQAPSAPENLADRFQQKK